MYECTNTSWWGCGLQLDAKEWEQRGTYPRLNKTGTSLAEVRTSLKNKIGNHEDVLLKSPRMLIKSVEKLSQEICSQQGSAIVGEAVLEAPPEKTTNKLQIQNSTSSDTDADEPLMETEGEDEESSNIEAGSDASVKSAVKGENSSKIDPLDITGPDGKLVIEQVLNWSIPKVKKMRRENSGSYPESSTSNQALRDIDQTTSSDGDVVPQAHSTPYPGRQNQNSSCIVRRKFNPARRSEKK